jgi:predicted nucleic acid-binding protein
VSVPTSGAGLLDTRTLILMQRLEGATLLPAVPMISAVTLAEPSIGPLVATSERERASRLALLQQVEADFQPLPFDDAAARCFGRVSASLRRARRKPAARAYDALIALIAAIAMAHDLPIYTVNPRDFAGIDDLRVVAIPHPDQE